MGNDERSEATMNELYTVDELQTIINQRSTLFSIIRKRDNKILWTGTSQRFAEAWLRVHLIFPEHLLPKNKLAQAVADVFRQRRSQ